MSNIPMKEKELIQLYIDLEQHKRHGITLENLEKTEEQTFYINKILDVIVVSFSIVLFFLSQNLLFLFLLIPYILYFYKK